MSYVTSIKGLPITHAASIEKAVERLIQQGIPCGLRVNDRPQMWYNDPETDEYEDVGICDYVIDIEGSEFDLGLKKDHTGNYELIFDSYAYIIASKLGKFMPPLNGGKPWTDQERLIGSNVGKFVEAYYKEVFILDMREQGIDDSHLSIESLPNGEQLVILTITDELDLLEDTIG